jgi:hypothetical protein
MSFIVFLRGSEKLGERLSSCSETLFSCANIESQFDADRSRAEVSFLSLKSSPAFVRESEGNGCVELFFGQRCT